MLKNYLKVALRNLWKDRAHAFVNISGLAIGVACCLLIMLFIQHEWSFDRFHTESDRIYRVWGREDWGEGREFFYTITPAVLGEALQSNIPEVEHSVRIRGYAALVGPEGERFRESLRMVDTTFFEVFDFPLSAGSFSSDPNSVVITREIARKYFGTVDAVGQNLTIDIAGQPEEYLVTGVAEEPPVASSIQFDLLIPFTKAPDLMGPGALANWFSISVETYVLLREGAAPAAIDAKLPAMIRQVLGEEAETTGYQLGLQPLEEIHLDTSFPTGIQTVSDPVYSYILAAVALLILLVACINFVTLSIGQSMRRSSEVGIRKSLGAGRSQLMRQFWGEAFLVVVTALLIGVAFGRMALPYFNDLSGRELVLVFEPELLVFLLLLALVIGGIAGVYPALVLSGLRPIEVLRDRIKVGGDRSILRRALIVVQFSIAILMIGSTLVVAQQLRFLQNRDLGFTQDHVIVLRTNAENERSEMLAERLRSVADRRLEAVSIAYSAFALDEGAASIGFEADDGTYRQFKLNMVSSEFLETMDIDLVAGRGFSADRPADSSALVVNESFVRSFGFASPEDALGKRLPGRSFRDHEIVGVVQDFNYQSLHNEIQPLVLVISPDLILQGAADVNVPTSTRRKIAVRILPGDLSSKIAYLERAWNQIAPDLPLDFYFLDQALEAQYRQEERLARIVVTASFLAVLIACLGLFGLATLTVARRTKEIGIRKILGADVTGIVALLSRDFAVLVAAAFIVAAPVGYLLAARWLEDFAFRTDAGLLAFLAAGLIALVSALLTVSYHALRAATADPVKSLRYE